MVNYQGRKELANKALEYCQVPGCLNKNIIKTAYCSMHMLAWELLEALKALSKEINLSKLNIRKDFALMNAKAYADKIIANAEVK